jgi:hypothetical protein
LARTLRVFDGDHFYALREVAVCKPAWWYFAPLFEELLPEGELSLIWTADRLDARLAEEPDVYRSDGLVWLYSEEPCAVWLAFSEICAEIVAKADAWRRQRRIALKNWPGWM